MAGGSKVCSRQSPRLCIKVCCSLRALQVPAVARSCSSLGGPFRAYGAGQSKTARTPADHSALAPSCSPCPMRSAAPVLLGLWVGRKGLLCQARKEESVCPWSAARSSMKVRPGLQRRAGRDDLTATNASATPQYGSELNMSQVCYAYLVAAETVYFIFQLDLDTQVRANPVQASV